MKPLSRFGTKIAQTSGIGRLMDDLGDALASGDDTIMLGGGNPAHIPEVEEYFRRIMTDMMRTGRYFEHAIGDYSASQGDQPFIQALCELLRDQFNWAIGPENIVLTNGSQSAFFILFNLFAGECADGLKRRVLFPLAPEYIGYADVGLMPDMFVARKPEITHLDQHLFKYHVDFDAMNISDDIGAICLSRPTNPTGNVLTDAEIRRLADLAAQHDIPLIVDNAYGMPFPHIVFSDAEPVWTPETIVCMSLSKLGLPGVRTGIVIANEETVRMVAHVNAVMSLAPGTFGAAITTDLVRSREILHISRDIIQPFYKRKAEHALEQIAAKFDGVDWHVHKPEGAFFVWLWFRNLPITSDQLYERLKNRGVLIVPGHHFFPGLHDRWRHKHECIRVNYAASESLVTRGIEIIAEEVKKAYADN